MARWKFDGSQHYTKRGNSQGTGKIRENEHERSTKRRNKKEKRKVVYILHTPILKISSVMRKKLHWAGVKMCAGEKFG